MAERVWLVNKSKKCKSYIYIETDIFNLDMPNLLVIKNDNSDEEFCTMLKGKEINNMLEGLFKYCMKYN